MDELVISLLTVILNLLIIIGIFAVLVYVTKFLFNRIKNSSYFKSSRFLNPMEYLPEEEVNSQKQIFYLAMILLFVIIILYLIFMWGSGSINLLVLDIIVSVYLAIRLDTKSLKNKFLLFLLIPFGSMGYLLFSATSMIFDIGHILVYLYFIKVYYHKFVEFTETNSLGITIMLLFFIVFFSFFVTIVVEDVSPLDSIVMVSNAFTSNGYAVLGSSGWGKLNALFLVWSGFFLSGAGTATLTVAIVMRHVNSQFDNLEEKIRKNRKK